MKIRMVTFRISDQTTYFAFVQKGRCTRGPIPGCVMHSLPKLAVMWLEVFSASLNLFNEEDMLMIPFVGRKSSHLVVRMQCFLNRLW